MSSYMTVISSSGLGERLMPSYFTEVSNQYFLQYRSAGWETGVLVHPGQSPFFPHSSRMVFLDIQFSVDGFPVSVFWNKILLLPGFVGFLRRQRLASLRIVCGIAYFFCVFQGSLDSDCLPALLQDVKPSSSPLQYWDSQILCRNSRYVEAGTLNHVPSGSKVCLFVFLKVLKIFPSDQTLSVSLSSVVEVLY